MNTPQKQWWLLWYLRGPRQSMRWIWLAGKTPLDYGILPGIPAEVVAEHRRNLPDDGAVCRSYLSEGKHLDVGTFLSWLDAHKGAEGGPAKWLQEQCRGTGQEQRRGTRQSPLHCALSNRVPAAVAFGLLDACPDACKDALHPALRIDHLSEAMLLAMIAACPEAVKEMDRCRCCGPCTCWNANCRTTPLHVALQNKHTTEAVVAALVAAWPEAVNAEDGAWKTPLDYRILPGIPAEVVAEYRRNLPDDGDYYYDGAVCRSYLSEGKHLDVDAFLSWLDAHKGAEGNPAEWLQEKDNEGDTPLTVALTLRAPAAAALGLIDACPEAANIVGYVLDHDDSYDLLDEDKDIARTHSMALSTPLEDAVNYFATEPVVAALISAWPGAVKAVNCHGETPLHFLAMAVCNSPAERKHKSTLCYTLVKKGGSLAAISNVGNTPATSVPKAIEDNFHLLASLREIAAYKKRTHLSLMHFRDWTTVSHAWCTPSAKLVAVTVLLVGDTFKRGLLPRLPMDCWYRILNCIPRHELRLGDCEPDAEQAALVQYLAILQDTRASIEATNAAAAAAVSAAARA